MQNVCAAAPLIWFMGAVFVFWVGTCPLVFIDLKTSIGWAFFWPLRVLWAEFFKIWR